MTVMIIPTPDRIIRHLFNKTSKGIQFGLERILLAARRIGDPQNAFSSIHVAGTNGKGSTCAYIESIARAHGYTTGLFTSPHIARFEERFIINGRPVHESKWVDVYSDLSSIIEEYNLTFFEAVTLISFELFKREKVHWGVFETGMGGRLDATNILVPKVAAICAIDMDHRQYLGADLVSIAREKLGIVKENVPLIMTKPPQPEIEALARAHCASLRVSCAMVSNEDSGACATNGNGSGFTRNGRKFVTNLHGSYQIQNAMLALATAEAAGFSDPVALAEGISRTFVPGRFQIVKLHNRLAVFDVGHNPQAAGAFARTVRHHFDGLSVCIVAGIMNDKDIDGILQMYCSVASKIICAQPKTDRAAPAGQIASKIPPSFKGVCEIIPEVGKAVAAALSGKEKVVCVTGSFFTVGEAMIALGIEPYGIYR